MHLHLCYDEYIVLMAIWDNVSMYYYHYKHTIASLVTRINDKRNCRVCADS
jgi:hypothetical protein